MAIDQTMNEDDEREMTPPPRKGGFMKIVLIVFSVLLLIGASIGGTLVFTGALNGLTGAQAEAPEVDRGKRPAAKISAPIYVELGDPFVVNFIEGNQIRYLQVKIEVMTRDTAIPQAITTHLPKIRNNLVFMFSGFDYTTLASVTGKQKIRDEALAEIQSILSDEIGNPGIESVYFTSFVMQ